MSFGLVPSDSAVSNGRVSGTLVANRASFAQLFESSNVVAGDVVATTGTFDHIQSLTGTIDTLDSVTTTVDTLTATTATIETLDAVTGTVDTLTATTGTVHTLNSSLATLTVVEAVTINTDTIIAENCDAVHCNAPILNSTTATLTTVNSTTVNATTINATTVNATTFPSVMCGSAFVSLDADTTLDVYVNPNSNILVAGHLQPATTVDAVWFTPSAITVTAFRIGNANVPIANAIGVSLEYGSALGSVTTTVFPLVQLTNATSSQTGSVTIPAGSYIGVHLSITAPQAAITATINTGWIITFH